MEVQEILNGQQKLVTFLKEKGFSQEKDYSDDEFTEGIYFKIDKKKLLVVYEVSVEDKIKEIKDHFLIDRGLSYCIVVLNGKLIFFRNFGETKHFIYSDRTKNNPSKLDKLKNITTIDSLFQSKDISALFYEAFKVKRNLLVQNIKNDVEPIQKYLISQKIFDRFFFIYFLCHKGIIKFKDGRNVSGENLFTKILLKNGNFLQNLKNLFHLFNSQEKNILEIGEHQISIPYLNGGLFRPDVLEQDLDIKLKEAQWEDIFEFLNSYHWIIEDVKAIEENEEKILTPEILGHVYERSVVEWESEGFEKEVENAVKKITERKKKGVYYTPESITDYISNNTIIPHLLDKLDNKYSTFEELIESKDSKSLKDAIKIIDEIKVLDPACGSGAFLIKASEVILGLKRRINYKLKNKKNYYDLKLDIITENIYGVDILAGAIEISKLRLWLWLISDFEDSKNEIKALPNIEYNLKVGNSLVGWLDEKLVQMPMNTPLTEKVDGIFTGLIAFSENGDGEELKKARELLRAYKLTDYIEAYYILYKIYRRTHGLKAENLRSILETIRKSIYATVTPAFLDYVNKKIKPNYDSKKPPISQTEFSELQVFHWRIDFGHIILNGGFDVVISNPPYIKEYNNRRAFDGIRWSDYYMGKMDIWYFFACRSSDLLVRNGRLSFIAQNNWVTSYGASIMRDKIIKEMTICQLLDFGDFKVFQDAGIQTMIMIFKKDNQAEDYALDYRKLTCSAEVKFADLLDLLNKTKNDFVEYLTPKIRRVEYTDTILTFGNKDIELILKKIKSQQNLTLDENEVAQGIVYPQDSLNKKNQLILGDDFEVGDGIFVLTTKEKKNLNLTKEELEIIKPTYTTKELGKYYSNPKNECWTIYTSSDLKHLNVKKYPNLKKHLDKFKDIITSDNAPHGLHRARDERFFTGEKVIAVRKCIEPIFSYSNFDCYVSATFYVIKSDRLNMKYLTGLLNSNLILFWLKNKGKMQGNNFQIDKEPILGLPIRTPSDTFGSKIVNIVDCIIKKKIKNEVTNELEKEIDNLVYEMYSLSKSDIKIIEENLKNERNNE